MRSTFYFITITNLLFLAAGLLPDSGFDDPMPNINFDKDASTDTYIIMYSMPEDPDFVETYVKKYNKENHAAVIRDRLVQEDEESKLVNKKGKGRGKGKGKDSDWKDQMLGKSYVVTLAEMSTTC